MGEAERRINSEAEGGSDGAWEKEARPTKMG